MNEPADALRLGWLLGRLRAWARKSAESELAIEDPRWETYGAELMEARELLARLEGSEVLPESLRKQFVQLIGERARSFETPCEMPCDAPVPDKVDWASKQTDQGSEDADREFGYRLRKLIVQVERKANPHTSQGALAAGLQLGEADDVPSPQVRNARIRRVLEQLNSDIDESFFADTDMVAAETDPPWGGPENVLQRLRRKAVQIWGSQSGPEPLTPREQRVHDIVRQHGPITGPGIIGKLQKIYSIGMSESTLTRHIIPELKRKRRLTNTRPHGYHYDGQLDDMV